MLCSDFIKMRIYYSRASTISVATLPPTTRIYQATRRLAGAAGERICPPVAVLQNGAGCYACEKGTARQTNILANGRGRGHHPSVSGIGHTGQSGVIRIG